VLSRVTTGGHVVNILTLCTGNVARSVMLSYMLSDLADANGFDWRVRSAGTHVTEGLAMSSRTRNALLAIADLGEHRYGQHRSHQIDAGDVAWADVILAAELDHVRFVRETFGGGVFCVQLGHFATYARPATDVSTQLSWLSTQGEDASLDVADPAGGDQSVYDACARQLWDYAQTFAAVVASPA
jgi:protein arginine phosphatase